MEDSSGNDPENSEASVFNSEHHVNFMEEIFRMYNFEKSVKDWAVCQIADSAAVNIRIAKDLGHSRHISCKNHNLNLECQLMVSNNNELDQITKKIESVSASVRNSCKLSAALRNEAAASDQKLWNIRPKGKCTTRAWLGHAVVVQRHLKLREYYRRLMDDNMGNIVEHRDTVEHHFIEKAESHLKQLKQMKDCSELIQTEKLPWWKYQIYLGILVRTTFNSRNRSRGNQPLGQKYIAADNGLSTDPHFETGVAKIQQGLPREEMMTSLESHACEVLLKSNNDT